MGTGGTGMGMGKRGRGWGWMRIREWRREEGGRCFSWPGGGVLFFCVLCDCDWERCFRLFWRD